MTKFVSHKFFTIRGEKFPADGIIAIVPTETGVSVRWAQRAPMRFDNITSTEILAKVEDAKASTDSD